MRFLINNRLKKYQYKSQIASSEEIIRAKTVMFALFSRYGDGIISLVVIKEFIKKYPNKQYIIAISRQQLPYARELINSKNTKIISINKRNPMSFFKGIFLLKKSQIDIAFNPWSRGSDSEYYLTFATRFIFFRDIDNFKKTDNLYNRIRSYLDLDLLTDRAIIKPQFTNIKNIIIAPFSTDIKKNLTINATNELTLKLTSLFPHAKIRVALTGDFLLKKFVAKKFIWTKSTKNSQKYLNLLKQTDLFVGVDSGPLHLSLALNIPTIAIFGATAPATILDYKTEVLIWRDIKLTKYFCQVGKCKNAICISNAIKQENLLNYNYQVIENLKYERKNCPLELN